MFKNLMLVVLASMALSVTPAFAGGNGVCTDTEKDPEVNMQDYSVATAIKDPKACCCKKDSTSNKFNCSIVTSADCPTSDGTIKLSGPDYCPCFFTRDE